MKNKKGFLIASGIGIAAGAAIAAFLGKKNKRSSDYLLEDSFEDEMYLNFSENTTITKEESEKKALEAAKARLGSGAAIASASDNKALTVNIGGKRRHCFMFGAVGDDLPVNSETLIIYVDATTGEVFASDEID